MNQLELIALLPVAQRYAALVLVWTTLAVAGCSGNQLPSAALVTPQATLDTARQAMADSDFETFCECLTDDAVYDLAGMLRGMYELSQKFSARPGSTPRKTEDTEKAQKMIALIERYMPADAPQPKRKLGATAEERRARRREAGKAVRKPKEFIAEVLKLAAASQKGDATKTQFTVIDVQVDGETANAKVNRPALGNQVLPVTLRREDGVWKIDDWEFVNAMTIDPAVVKPSDPAFTKQSADKVPDVPPASMKIPEEPVSGKRHLRIAPTPHFDVHLQSKYVEIKGWVDTTTNTFTIASWRDTSSVSSEEAWTPQAKELPLVLLAYKQDGAAFDVPKDWDGQLSGFAFLLPSDQDLLSVMWNEGTPSEFWNGASFGWGGLRNSAGQVVLADRTRFRYLPHVDGGGTTDLNIETVSVTPRPRN